MIGRILRGLIFDLYFHAGVLLGFLLAVLALGVLLLVLGWHPTVGVGS